MEEREVGNRAKESYLMVKSQPLIAMGVVGDVRFFASKVFASLPSSTQRCQAKKKKDEVSPKIFFPKCPSGHACMVMAADVWLDLMIGTWG